VGAGDTGHAGMRAHLIFRLDLELIRGVPDDNRLPLSDPPLYIALFLFSRLTLHLWHDTSTNYIYIYNIISGLSTICQEG
jgi:hypothetical protein